MRHQVRGERYFAAFIWESNGIINDGFEPALGFSLPREGDRVWLKESCMVTVDMSFLCSNQGVGRGKSASCLPES